MSFAATNERVWKEKATEKEDAARMMSRIAMGLSALCFVLAFTAMSAHWNYSRICSFVDQRQQAQAASYGEEEFTVILKTQYCS
ncbi:MAG: hypothetical protein HKN11_12845 [Rhizobiales bacterium]|nr:hypothetical protein [Hyphomicrobiales bacterium]